MNLLPARRLWFQVSTGLALGLGLLLCGHAQAATTVTIGSGTEFKNFPMRSVWQQVRTQVIYLASEIGPADNITSLALDVTTVPDTMTNWTIRIKHTAMAAYTTPSWEDSGWTTVYQANVDIGATGWCTFTFSIPFAYNGTDNLLVDFSLNDMFGWGNWDGYCRYSIPGGNRTAHCYGDALPDPLTWSGTTPLIKSGVENTTYVPNVRLTLNTTYSVSGTITCGGKALAGVTVTPLPSGAAATTDASGNYTISDLAAGPYTITPSLPGYDFSSSAITVGPNVTDEDFTATASSYLVTFNALGGTDPNPATMLVTYGLAYGTLATTARPGYTFAGWWTGANGAGTQVTAVTSVTATANHTLYAKYALNITLPTVTTTVSATLGTTTATSGGTVTSDGGAVVTARGVCWSTTANPTVANAKTTDGTGTGAFTSTLTRLSPNTTYYVRAYATNSAGTGYGAPQSFKTPVSAGADFVVTNIVFTPALPAVGGKFTATITVKNQGLLSGKAGYLYVWLNKPGTAAVGEKGDKSASVSTLKPGASKTVKMSLTTPKTWDTFTLRAFIDAKNGVKEDDEYNNQETYVYDTGLPDFEILAVRLSPELPLAGKTFTAYVTVTNSGEVAGDAGYLDVWADSSVLAAAPVPGPKTKGNKYKTVGVLQPDQQKTITVTGLKTPVGTAWTLGVLIDSRAKTVELNETNNWFEFDYGASDTPPLPPPPPG